MPIDASLHPNHRLVRIEVTGSFSTEEILETITGVVEHPDFAPGFNVLSDHRGVTEFMTTDQARAMSLHLAALSRQFAGSRWAVVASSEVTYGMMRMTAAFLDSIPMEVQVFEVEAEAEAWLGLGEGSRDASG